jgi:hypothetical protein
MSFVSRVINSIGQRETFLSPASDAISATFACTRIPLQGIRRAL